MDRGRGSPWLKAEACYSQAPRASAPLAGLGQGPRGSRVCEQKAPRILSVVLLFGGGSPELFFSLELCLPKQETVVLCCHYFLFFKNRSMLLSLTLGSSSGEWG